MNSSRRGYNTQNDSFANNYSDSGSSISNIPFYLLSQALSSFSENQSSNYSDANQYNNSQNSSQSSNSFPSSFDYSGAQNNGSFQYNATLSSDMYTNQPFTYADNDAGNNKRKNRGYQPWVKRDSLKRPGPYAGGRGINLMQKMGWNPGQGLGPNGKGDLEPHFPEIKMDKRGLDGGKIKINSNGGGSKQQTTTIKLVTEGKNALSILEEYCSKRKMEAPKYTAVVDEGPVHAKNYVFKVAVNGVDYTADKGSNVKKTARLEAAKKCLVDLGVLPKE